jgi:hypothetical protein
MYIILYARINQLHEVLNITLDNRIKEVAKKLERTYTDHKNTLIRVIRHGQHNLTPHYTTPVMLGN